jgi:hypothetical protein
MTDDPMIRQAFRDEVDLKIIGFLEHHEVTDIF